MKLARSPKVSVVYRAFRDHHHKIRSLHAEVYGLSTQTPEAQMEIAARLGLPFALLSDAGLRLARAPDLPTFTIEGDTLIKRLTLIFNDGTIEKVFYPVFPPDKSADEGHRLAARPPAAAAFVRVVVGPVLAPPDQPDDMAELDKAPPRSVPPAASSRAEPVILDHVGGFFPAT
jgi:Redoxin